MGRREQRAEVRRSGPAVAYDHSIAISGVVLGGLHVNAVPTGDEARRKLAGLVARQWEKEAVDHLQLDNPDAIPVRWHPVHDRRLMDSAQNLTASSLRLAFTSQDLRPRRAGTPRGSSG